MKVFSYLMVSTNKMINISLNDDLLEDFNKNGFLVLDKFIDLQYLEDLSEIISKVATPGGITESLVDQLDKTEALSSWGKGMDTILTNNKSKK